MIITIGGIKGGSGKTTVATHLRSWPQRPVAKVLLVDADDQQTAAEFTACERRIIPSATLHLCSPRRNGRPNRSARVVGHYDHIIIDTGGRDPVSQRAALWSPTLLVPFVPRSFDIWTLTKVATLVEEMRLANSELGATCS